MAICEICGEEERVSAWSTDCGCSRLTPAEQALLSAAQSALEAHFRPGIFWGIARPCAPPVASPRGTVVLSYYQPPVDDSDAVFLRSLGIAP